MSCGGNGHRKPSLIFRGNTGIPRAKVCYIREPPQKGRPPEHVVRVAKVYVFIASYTVMIIELFDSTPATYRIICVCAVYERRRSKYMFLISIVYSIIMELFDNTPATYKTICVAPVTKDEYSSYYSYNNNTNQQRQNHSVHTKRESEQILKIKHEWQISILETTPNFD